MSWGDSTTGIQMIQHKVLVSENQGSFLHMITMPVIVYFTNAAADSGIGESLQNLPKSQEIGKLLATLMASL